LFGINDNEYVDRCFDNRFDNFFFDDCFFDDRFDDRFNDRCGFDDFFDLYVLIIYGNYIYKNSFNYVYLL
jgi:hypothetical protein